MKVRDIVEALNLRVLSTPQGLEREVKGCYVSDLLSDVMGNADAGFVWVTLQTHRNVAAIASLKELACVILVKGFVPSPETIAQSNEDGVTFLSTSMETFELAGRLYDLMKS